MRSPGVIYRKYRQQIRKKLYYLTLESYKKMHENCVYGYSIKYRDTNNRDRSSKICLYGVLGGATEGDKINIENFVKLDVCTCASECNAFAPKRTKEEVAEKFESDISDYNQCKKLYPEIAVYKWVLDRDQEYAKKKPNIINRLIVFLIDILENSLKL